MTSQHESELVFSESTLPLITEDSYFNALPFADNNSASMVEDCAKQWASSVSKRWYSGISHYLYCLFYYCRWWGSPYSALGQALFIVYSLTLILNRLSLWLCIQYGQSMPVLSISCGMGIPSVPILRYRHPNRNSDPDANPNRSANCNPINSTNPIKLTLTITVKSQKNHFYSMKCGAHSQHGIRLTQLWHRLCHNLWAVRCLYLLHGNSIVWVCPCSIQLYGEGSSEQLVRYFYSVPPLGMAYCLA